MIYFRKSLVDLCTNVVASSVEKTWVISSYKTFVIPFLHKTMAYSHPNFLPKHLSCLDYQNMELVTIDWFHILQSQSIMSLFFVFEKNYNWNALSGAITNKSEYVLVFGVAFSFSSVPHFTHRPKYLINFTSHTHTRAILI